MSQLSSFLLGASLILGGALLWLAVRYFIRRIFRENQAGKQQIKASEPQSTADGDAVMLVSAGGKVEWVNDRLREMFKLKAGITPDLEMLARRFPAGEELLRLCAKDDETRFVINHRPIEAHSYSTMIHDQNYHLVVFREAASGLDNTYAQSSGQAVQMITRLTQPLSASLDIEDTLQVMLENIERLVPADLLEISLLDPAAQEFTPYRLSEKPESMPCLEREGDTCAADEGFTGYVARQRTSVLIQDVSSFRLARPNARHSRLRLQSYIGIPLQLGDQLIGVLELGSFESNGFRHNDLELLKLIAAQGVISIHNAQLFRKEQLRVKELDSLARLTQAFNSIRDPRGLYEHLVDSVAAVIPVDVLGFLIYNENTRMLEGCAPFSGIPAQFMELYRVPIPTGSLLEKSFLGQEVILTANAAEDARWADLGLAPIAAAASLRETAMIPLTSGGTMIGYLQASNHADGKSAFSQDELHLLTIIASQAAPIIENSALLHQLRQRAQRAEGLRKIASLAASAATPNEILKYSLEELARLLRADVTAVFMIDQNRTAVHLHSSSCFGINTDLPQTLTQLMIEDAQFPFTAAGSLHAIHTDHGLLEKPLVPFYQNLMAAIQVESMLAAPLVVLNESIGEVWVGSRQSEFFDPGDLPLITAAAGQLASVVERLIDDRSEELRREHHRLETMLKVTTELSASLDIRQILVRSLTVVNEALGAQESLILVSQGGGIYRAGENLVDTSNHLHLADGSIEQQIHEWAVKNRSTVLVNDLDQDARWSRSPDQKNAANSFIAIPLVLGEEVLGSMLLLHSRKDVFHTSQIDLLEAIARQVASTLKNAELFNLIRDQAEILGGMLREQQIESSRSRAILEAVADGVIVTDASRSVTLINDSAERILEEGAGQLVGQPLEALEVLLGEAGRDWLNTIRGWSTHPEKVQEGLSYAAQVNLGNDRVVAVHLAPVIWRSDFLGTVSIFRDITHQVQVDRLKSEFITNVSHELRTPLTPIKGYTDIMLMGAGGTLTDQQKHFLSVIRENALRLQGLVDDLLDVSRIQAGKIVLDYQPVDLKSIAEEVVADLRHLSRQENKAISYVLETPPDLPPAHGDRERIHQVLHSLALNSYKYTPENGSVTIRMSLVHAGRLQVDVQDTGIGIPTSDQPRIFERFFRGDNPLIIQTSGAGLGLALAKILIEMQDGRIWFTSNGKAGEGSTFSFSLPVDTGIH